MKKIKLKVLTVLMLFVASSVFISCETEDSDIVNDEKTNIEEFYKSNDFKNLIFDRNKIDYTLSKNTFIADSKTPIISIVYKKNNQIIGILEAIKLTDKTVKHKILPNNNDYAMFYKNYSHYNFQKNKGIIELIDVNYDYSLISKIELEAKKIKSVKNMRIKKEILLKHSYFNQSDLTTSKKIPSSCSGGSNGNVSWGECYDCITTICNSDPGCNSALNVADWASGMAGYGVPLGSVSIGAACVIISAIY